LPRRRRPSPGRPGGSHRSGQGSGHGRCPPAGRRGQRGPRCRGPVAPRPSRPGPEPAYGGSRAGPFRLEDGSRELSRHVDISVSCGLRHESSVIILSESETHTMANPFSKGWKYLMASFDTKIDENADPKVQIQQAT